MKIRNYIYALVAVMMISITSCKDQFELDLLNNPNAVTQENADIDLYFNAIQLNFNGFLRSVDGNARPAVRMSDLGATRYNGSYAGGDGGMWSNAYANIFPDIEAMIALAEPKDGFVWTGAAKVIKAWVLMDLVDLHGDIPYTEAGQGVAVKSPIADDQVAVYDAAFAMLDDAIADLTNPAAIGKPATDIYYSGDPTDWEKLANTLKMRYHLTTRLVNSGSGAAFQAIVAGGQFIDSASESFKFQYSTNQFNPNSRHPWYNSQYVNPGGGGAYLPNDLMLRLRGVGGNGGTVEDPRLRYYFYRQNLTPAQFDQFTLGCPGELRPDHFTATEAFCLGTLDHTNANSSKGYWGRDHGDGSGTPPDGDKKTNYGVYPAAGVFDENQGVNKKHQGVDGGLGKGIIPSMMYFYVDFMRAEAALTMGTSDVARDMFEAGMTNSINYVRSFSNALGAGAGASGSSFAPSSADRADFINSRLAIYDAATAGGKMDILMEENLRANWGAGMLVFNAYRRTGYPSNLQNSLEEDRGDFPRLLFYPNNYVNLNENATQRVITEQVFWDNNPAGFIN